MVRAPLPPGAAAIGRVMGVTTMDDAVPVDALGDRSALFGDTIVFRDRGISLGGRDPGELGHRDEDSVVVNGGIGTRVDAPRVPASSFGDRERTIAIPDTSSGAPPTAKAISPAVGFTIFVMELSTLTLATI